jgi:hypothetical protein
MKLGDPTAQCDIQSVCSDDKLDDMGILSFVRDRFNSMTFTHITLAGSATGTVRKIAQSVRFRIVFFSLAMFAAIRRASLKPRNRQKDAARMTQWANNQPYLALKRVPN